MRYGINECNHSFVLREGGYEEQCCPVICERCGAFGCVCDAEKLGLSWEDIKDKCPLSAADNVNGRWVNPYVTRKDEQVV